jgi:hypothetical protein
MATIKHTVAYLGINYGMMKLGNMQCMIFTEMMLVTNRLSQQKESSIEKTSNDYLSAHSTCSIACKLH